MTQESFDLQKSWEKFKQTLPVFALLGKVVTPPDEYDVNAHENMQLVFKYFKAYKDNKLDQVICMQYYSNVYNFMFVCSI